MKSFPVLSQVRLRPLLVISELLFIGVLAFLASQIELTLVLLLPFGIGVVWAFRRWPAFGLIVASAAGMVVSYFAQRLKRDHDSGGPVAGPLAARHAGPPAPNTVRGVSDPVAVTGIPRGSRHLVRSRSIELAALCPPCTAGSPAWWTSYHRAFGCHISAGGKPGA